MERFLRHTRSLVCYAACFGEELLQLMELVDPSKLCNYELLYYFETSLRYVILGNLQTVHKLCMSATYLKCLSH